MRWPLIILGIYVIASIVTFIAYGLDKRAASRGAWRIRERTLHLLELAGGWPGALLAQQVFRHKTRDFRFRLVFWSVVALHLALWIGFAVLRWT